MTRFAQIADGRENWSACTIVARHRHECAYAAIVLAGGYEECGSRGRFRVGPGDVLLHGAFDAHLNRFAAGDTQILNLALGALEFSAFSAGRVADADAIARTAEDDSIAARACLREQLRDITPGCADWPDMLADELRKNARLRLAAWARTHGLTPETVSRGFRKVFGVSPAAFRSEARARAAFALIAGGSTRLADIAAETGFADQAHMSRATRALTGKTPDAWRRSNSFKTELGRKL